MENKTTFLAVDLGATSGRTILGTLQNNKVELEELTRFENNIIQTCGHFYWDIYALYNEVLKSLQLVAQKNIQIQSIGIDTWGCDFVCIAPDGAILRNPRSYRDPHTAGAMQRYFAEKISRQEVYQATGIQLMDINSLFQLYTMQRNNDSALHAASKILFMPDALSYLLTGKAVCEYTVASTSQMLSPVKKQLDERLLASVGLQREQFGAITFPGTTIGTLTPEVQKITGLGAIPVIAVAGHDTASAVAAVPASNKNFAYLSSGTWSLMGIETDEPIINDESYRKNFTNEGGVEGTTRFLKNICGMWIYERCRKEWQGQTGIGHAELQQAALQAEPFRSLINPDDACFANPEFMEKAIRQYCENTQQPIPQTHAEVCRCIFDSLALRYRQTLADLRAFAQFPIETLHIIGGGSRNEMLNQFTADSCGITVLAGPQECTALGNIMLQAKAAGQVNNIHDMRSIIAQSVDLKRFEPRDTVRWNEAYTRYINITK